MFRIFNRVKYYSHAIETHIEANTYRRAAEFNSLK